MIYPKLKGWLPWEGPCLFLAWLVNINQNSMQILKMVSSASSVICSMYISEFFMISIDYWVSTFPPSITTSSQLMWVLKRPLKNNAKVEQIVSKYTSCYAEFLSFSLSILKDIVQGSIPLNFWINLTHIRNIFSLILFCCCTSLLSSYKDICDI